MCRTLSFFMITILLITSCVYKEDLVLYPDFDRDLWPYLNTFEEEAAIRGVSISIDDLDVEGIIRKVDNTGVAGWCRYSPSQPNLITIDKKFWEEASSIWREFVIFHELGHCVLSRGHRETQDANGNCISIMQSGNGTCRVVYSDQTREGYLDELFDPLGF